MKNDSITQNDLYRIVVFFGEAIKELRRPDPASVVITPSFLYTTFDKGLRMTVTTVLTY